MAFAHNNGVRLHWQEQGDGSPILLIMGHSYSSALWYPILPALVTKHRVIWFDNRGTGESDTTPEVTLPDLAADALAVLDAAGVERAHVFGVSMGGGIALELALQQPRRAISLVLGCTGVFTRDKPRMPAFLRVLYYLPPWALRLLLRNRTGYGSAAPPDRIAFDQAMLKQDKSTVRGVIAQAAAVSAYVVTTDRVATLTMPALVLHGDEDRLVPFAWGVELAKTLPNARLVTMHGAGHNFMVARGEQAATTVLDFIRRVETGVVSA
jgi:pimeloyl-ACP methyl ester carboxylesterase